MNKSKNLNLGKYSLHIKRLLTFAAIFIVTILLFDFIIMPLYTKHGQSYDLPDVTEIPVSEAIKVLNEQGYEPIVQDSIYDEHFAPGSVIQQNPLPFTKVKKGRRVYLIMSIGEKPRYVPRLISLTLQDAEFLIRDSGLELNEKIVDFSDFYPRGVVMNQSLPPGEVIKKNQNINITVSLGPAPTSPEVPNLTGKSLASAEKELEAVGLKIGMVKYSFRPNLVPGTILRQSVSPGQKVTRVDSVNLIISTDKPVEDEVKGDSIQ